MPRSALSTARLFSLLGRPLSEEEMREALFRTKVEPSGFAEGKVDVEVNADRLDLLDEGGLAWALQGSLGIAQGLPYRPEAEALPGVEVRVNASVAPLRPDLEAAVMVAPGGRAVDEGLLEELVRYQELLHATLGRDRTLVSLGWYPLDRLQPPFHYAMEPAGQVRFTPLGSSGEVTGTAFYAEHPMARRYGALGRRDDLILTLRDDARAVLSLPPVLNAAGAGEVRAGDRRVLLEATGTRPARTREMIGYAMVPFLARGWKVHPVPRHGPAGSSSGRETIAPREMPFSTSPITTLLGSRLTAAEIETALLSSRLGVVRTGSTLQALLPPWRSDLLSPVDLAEEVAIARGYDSFPPILPPSPSQGRRLPERRARSQLVPTMIGLGYQELHTSVLTSPESARRLAPEGEAVVLRNPIALDYSRARSVLRTSLLDALARNLGAPYPQRVFEIAPVIARDAKADTGTRTDVHLSAAEAGEGAGFARMAGLAERLFVGWGFQPSREAADAPGSIPGRVARLKIAGETVALLGEVHPSVLAELKLGVPVAWLEVDLSQLELLQGAKR